MSHYQPVEYPRQWLPTDAKFTVWSEIEPWYNQLAAWPIESSADLATWMSAFDEVNAGVAQERDQRYIAMTCQTDDPDREAAYLEYVREIEPKVKPTLNQLRSKYLDNPFRDQLPADRRLVLDRSWANRRSLFREANVARETELAELGQKYQKLIGAMTVTYQGEEKTLARMAKYQQETDRAVREECWRLTTERRLQNKDELDEIFDRMIVLRGEIAQEAGFSNYVDYAYRERDRFDYGPEEAANFQNAIEKAVVPLVRKLHDKRKASLGVDVLRPWDVSVDPLGRSPLRPFENADLLADGVQTVLERVDSELAAQFAFMKSRGLLDLANRKGKAPGGYQTTLETDRLPFIFMNAVGVDDDIRTLLHEGGHAFHTLASRHETIAAYREAPIEFCEVASMTMELFGSRDLDVFYSQADCDRSYRQLLEGIVTILPWIAIVDAFQHWIYRNPNHTREDRQNAWSGLVDRFGAGVDWTGLEDRKVSQWHRQLHIFLYPFYYIEYGIAQLGALQIWTQFLIDKAKAVASYRQGLSLGGSRPLPELFTASGARFDFRESTIVPLMEAIDRELALLPE